MPSCSRPGFPIYTIYLPNYRGYGGSDGAPDEVALYADALNIYDAVATDHQQVSVIGRSVGTAVATHLAANRDVDRLVLVTPFAEMVSIAQKAFVVFPMQWLLTEQHRSIDRVSDISAATLLLVAEWDEIVPADNVQKLITAFGSQAQTVTIETAGHNNIQTFMSYQQAIQDFMR